ncbi:TonB-dependent receptor [Salegentibacter sediminis]|uniref:TonB-dependent receptor n=1 Tax=Salegentibacter sediminis TaxID=1930251 RepID=UPI0009C01010|nr:TonB-dependent receptor [Salegentibacter sediminis]
MRKLLALALFLTTATIFAQGTITGTVIDSELNSPLPGATVMEVGTNNGTTTDFDGNFSLDVNSATGSISISFVGYEKITRRFNVAQGATQDLGRINLSPDADALSEVIVVGRGVIDLEEDRRTPIAVSTITKAEIQKKAAGNVEFPEILKNTPSVYVANQAGGFGDSQMFLRGFSQNNTAFLLNGQPINGMEDGNMYWSNWSGISDIANAVQVQRGLGSSKLAISSVGGTVNIVTKATERSEGGFVRGMVGNGSYLKGTVSYDTGINDNGWGFSFLLDHWQGHSKYADGTKGQGQNYFFSVGKKMGDHNFNFLLTGAPQWHDQNFSKSMDLYEEYGVKYNNNYGFLDGEYLTSRRNYYHKPVTNLNWDWNISDKSDLSTVVYASFGRGGGTGTYGNGPNYIDNGIDSNPSGAFTQDGLIDWDFIKNDYNASIEGGLSEGYNGTLLRASVNNHAWYGAVSNFSHDTETGWAFNVGADLRWYTGDHFRQLTDLLGLQGRIEPMGSRPDGYVVSETFEANPWSALFDYADEDQRINYDYSEDINYQGGFGQVEYANDMFSVFFQGAVSNQSYQRTDRGNFATAKTSEKVNKTGYNLKGGASFNINEQNVVFANVGKYSRQPFLDNIFPSYSDNTELADPEVENEEIFGLEAGYQFETADFQANLNAYYTKWENRFLNASGEYNPSGSEVPDYADASFLFTNIGQVHQGLELDVKYRPVYGWTLKAYATIGDWKYDGTTPVRVRDNETNSFVDELEANLTDTNVGLAPQSSFGLGTDVQITEKFSMDMDINHFANLYGFVDVEDVAFATLEGDTYQSEKLDAYTLVDLGASYQFDLGAQNIQLRGNVYNLFDNEYINQRDQYGYYYGNGLTWNFSVKYNF